MSKPSHTAYVVTKPEEGSNRKPVWYPVAAIWPHKNGNGFDIDIPPGVTLSGRIVCMERKDEQNAAEEAA
jgi:hypothetical protein